MGAIVLLSSFMPAKSEKNSVAGMVLDRAVKENVISRKLRQQIVDSEAIDVACQTFVSTKGDAKATVDAVADQLVKKGYFKNRSQAKAYAKRALERARKSDTVAQKVYRYFGL